MSSDSQSDHEAIQRAARLEALGFEVRAPSLAERVDEINHFNQHGNRALRRAQARMARKKGSGRAREHGD